MGQCCYHGIKSIDTLSSIDGSLNHSMIAEHYHVMISYAFDKRSIAKKLANSLTENGFHVWFHMDSNENTFNSMMKTVIDNSDCVILCLSESYAQSYRCQKEARYASDIRKTILMVNVSFKYQMKDWLSFIGPGKIQFYLEDRKLYFEILYQQIAREIKKCCTLDSTKPLIPESKIQLKNEDTVFQKLIKRSWRFDTSIGQGVSVWKTLDIYIGTQVRTEAEMKRREKLDRNLSIMAKRRQQLSIYFKTRDDNYFCKFASRMRQNLLDWENFCNSSKIVEYTINSAH